MKFLRRKLQSWFIDNPASVNETYWQHCRTALGFNGTLFRRFDRMLGAPTHPRPVRDDRQPSRRQAASTNVRVRGAVDSWAPRQRESL